MRGSRRADSECSGARVATYPACGLRRALPRGLRSARRVDSKCSGVLRRRVTASLFRREIVDMIEVANAVGAQFFRVVESAGGSW